MRPSTVGTATAQPERASSTAASRSRASSLPAGESPWTRTRPGGRRSAGATYRSIATGPAAVAAARGRATGARVSPERGRQRPWPRNSTRNAVVEISEHVVVKTGSASRQARASRAAALTPGLPAGCRITRS